MNRKKKIIIVAIIVISVLLGVGGGYFLYQKNVAQKEIDKKINEISEEEKKFSETDKREGKLEILKATLGEMEKYNASKGKNSKVSDKYKDVVSDMQAVFTEEYNTTIKDNTIEDFDKSEDIEILSKSQEALNTLLKTVESEKDYTFSDDSAYKEFAKKISDLTEGYSNRITTVEEQKKAEAEAEAKKKAKEEAQRQAEEK